VITNATRSNRVIPASSVPLYSAALQGVMLRAMLEGAAAALTQSCVITVSQKSVLEALADLLRTGSVTMMTALAVKSPFNATMRFTSLALSILHGNQTVGTLDPDRTINEQHPIVMQPSKQAVILNNIPVRFNIGIGTPEFKVLLEAMFLELSNGVTYVGAAGTIGVSAGDVALKKIAFSQAENVPVCPSYNTSHCAP